MSSETEWKRIRGRPQFMHLCCLSFGTVLFYMVFKLCSPLQTNDLIEKRDAATSAINKLASQRQSGGPLFRETIAGVDVMWQGDGDERFGSWRGILFVAHGCSHSHTDFWAPDDTICPECMGLPEERAIVKLAIDYNLVVVALSSQDRGSKCWSAQDGSIVAEVLKAMQSRLQASLVGRANNEQFVADDRAPPSPPILAFGASSGGYFVQTELAKYMEAAGLGLDGIIGQIAGRALDVSELKNKEKLTCIVYLTMNRDERTNRAAASAVQQLKEGMKIVEHIRLPPLPVSESFFVDRIGSDIYSNQESKTMVQALRTAGLLDNSGFITADPRQSNWRSVLQAYAKGGDSLVADRSPLSEVLNAAYGMHEMTRNGVKEALELCRLGSREAGTPNFLDSVYKIMYKPTNGNA